VYLYDTTVRNEDEKMATFHVNHFFQDLGSAEKVIAAIEHADGWNQAMREAGIKYAKARAELLPAAGGKAE
jgi:hypothetical protein